LRHRARPAAAGSDRARDPRAHGQAPAPAQPGHAGRHRRSGLPSRDAGGSAMIALRTFFTTAALLGAAAVASAQETLVIRGGTVHPVSGPSFVGSVVIQGGRIAALGANVDAPAGA